MIRWPVRVRRNNAKAHFAVSAIMVGAAMALLAAACGSSSSKLSSAAGQAAATPTSQPSTTQVSPASSKAASLSVIETKLPKYGLVLTTPSGFALYTYTADEPGGHGCTGACLEFWPPLLLPSGTTTPRGGAGVTGLATFVRGNRLQVTYKGLPLYTYKADTHPGQINGQNVVDSGGKWVLATVGSAPPPPSTPAGASTSQPPVTSPPATAAPVTAPPVTMPAATSPPATNPMVTSPMVTAPPVTAPPITRAPATVPPTTLPPKPAPTTVPIGPSY